MYMIYVMEDAIEFSYFQLQVVVLGGNMEPCLYEKTSNKTNNVMDVLKIFLLKSIFHYVDVPG